MGFKYEILSETKNVDSHVLHRIKSVRELRVAGVTVPEGTLGGWIEKAENLSHEGNCWIDSDAHVYGNAEVSGNAAVLEQAVVCGDAKVKDNAIVTGNAFLGGHAKVEENSVISGNARVYGTVRGTIRVLGSGVVRKDIVVTGVRCIGSKTAEKSGQNPTGNAGELDLAQLSDLPEPMTGGRIILKLDKIPCNVKARVDSLKDPGFQAREKAWMDEADPERKTRKEEEMWSYLDKLGEELDAQDEMYRTMGPLSGNQQLFRDMAQEVTSFMMEYKVIKEPELTYLYDDRGILDRLFRNHITDPYILALKEKPEDLYLRIVGMHALGAGLYVTLMQNEFDHTADEFTPDEIEKIFSDFQNEDAYILGLRQCGIPVESNNKRVLDHLILKGMDAAKASAGPAIFEPENIKTYMQVLYNAGNAVIMRG